MSYQCTTLPSGLRVATQSMPGVKSAAVAVTVGVGSRHETDAQSGLSHVLEHMAFKGTARRNAKQIAEEFEDIGGNFNAYTSVENTVYYARMLAEHLPKATHLLADILQHSTFDAEELKREQDVILQEIAAHKDSPEDYINDLFDAEAYHGQALGRSVLGTGSTVAGFSREDVIRYMTNYYTTERMIISAAGDVQHDRFVALIADEFVQLRSAAMTVNAPTLYTSGTKHHKKDLEQTHILMGYPAPNQHADNYYTSQLLASILGGGMSSRLFQEIRENRGLVYHVGSYNVAYSDAAMLLMNAACAPENAADIPALMQHEFKKIAQHIDESELTRSKNQLITELAMACENSTSVASWIGRHLLTYNEYRNIDELHQRIAPISVEDIKRLAIEILEAKPTLVSLGN